MTVALLKQDVCWPDALPVMSPNQQCQRTEWVNQMIKQVAAPLVTSSYVCVWHAFSDDVLDGLIFFKFSALFIYCDYTVLCKFK